MKQKTNNSNHETKILEGVFQAWKQNTGWGLTKAPRQKIKKILEKYSQKLPKTVVAVLQEALVAKTPKGQMATARRITKMNKTFERRQTLMPNGIPRWVRCYDNGGRDEPNGTFDRYTVLYVGHWRKRNDRQSSRCLYVGMSAHPFHPQGCGMHGEDDQIIDTNAHGWAPMIGGKNHLGTRIPFEHLPTDCQQLVRQDYLELWGLKFE